MPKPARSKLTHHPVTASPVPSESDSLSLLAGDSAVGAFRSDREGRCVWVNEKWCEITGYSFHNALGEGWRKALHPEDIDRIFNEWKECSSIGQLFCSEYRFLRPDGTVRWVLGRATEQLDKEGKGIGYSGVIVDITELRQRPNRSQTTLPACADPQPSPRELEVARLLAEGLSNKQVGAKLGISVRTVEAHRARLMRKLRIKSAAGLVRFAIASGLVKD